VIEPQTSSLPDKISRQFSHGDGYSTVIRQLSHGYPTVLNYLTRLHISSIVIISLFAYIHSFIQPYLCTNSSCAHAHEVTKQTKHKTQKLNNKTKTKRLRTQNRPAGDRTSGIESTRQDTAPIFI
jgi:hydroxymethylpyrimidine pyrophosphatase-like HAD family hydrolase